MPEIAEKHDLSQYEYILAFAHSKHGDQKRKYSNAPYSEHLIEVATLLIEHNASSETIIAGILHDVLEDTPTTFETLVDTFGKNVAELVVEVSDVSSPEDGNRATRKAMDHAHLAKGSPAAQTIKLADIISNSPSIVENDRHFAPVFLNEIQQLLPMLTKGDKRLWHKAVTLVDSHMTTS